VNRNRVVAGAIGLVVVAGAVGWIAGSTITSPAEAAARAQAPTPSLITADVDERVLSADVIARGSIGYDDPISLSLGGAVGGDVDAQIVTFVPEEGIELTEGAVALEVAGRPVLLLEGELPVYRDMRPGSSGDDVLQLEQALNRLGYLAVADDTWGPETGAAIQSLYAKAGYSTNTTSSSDKDALEGARENVRFANQAVQDAQKALEGAGGATGSALLEMQAAVSDAQDALAIAQAQRTLAISSAQGAVTLAQNDIDALPAPANTHPDYPALLNTLTDATNALNATTVEQDALVAAAQRSLNVANARLSEAKSPGDLTGLRRALDDAKRQQAEANEQLVEIEKKVGTWIPSGELIFVKHLPVQVNSTTVRRGSTVSGSFMTVSGADIAMTVGVSEQDARRLNVGDTVIIDEPDLLDAPLEATISEIPDSSGSGRVQLSVLLEDIPPVLVGANVRVIIPVESTSGSVLVVPAAALSSVANGDVRVEVEDADKPGTTYFVTVTTGLAADGVVEVHPVDGTLRKGDRVVVGQADIGPAGGIGASSPDPTPAATSGTARD